MSKQISIFLMSMVFITGTAFGQYRIPDTGQTKCYDNEKEIPCPKPGEPFYGQDGNYSINPMSFTKLDTRGRVSAKAWAMVMVRDNNTGLIWEVKTDDGSVHTWQDAHDKFVRQINQNRFRGFSDWRLPKREELRSIVHYGKHNPAADRTFFPRIQSGCYFTADTTVWSSSVWGVHFGHGYDDLYIDESWSWYVRAVRGGQARSFDYLIINRRGTVTDKRTGLMWQQEEASKMAWEQALKYCENLDIAGYDDWRLPTIKELASLPQLDRYDTALDKKFFPNVHDSWYWTSTTRAYFPGFAWMVSFDSGCVNDYGEAKSSPWYVRAVRGGPTEAFAHLVTSQPKPAPAMKSKPEIQVYTRPKISAKPITPKTRLFSTKPVGWYPRQYALIIGIDHYSYMPDQELDNAVNDARAVAEMFKKMGFEVRKLYDRQATRKNIINEISKMKYKAGQNDSFVFYFAGHGQGIKLKSGRKEGYIIPYDADIDLSKPRDVIKHDLETISLNRLRTYSEDIGTKHILLMLDSCFSGLVMSKYRAIPPQVMNPAYYSRLLKYRAINILTAGDAQKVLDGTGHSPFTKWVLKALDEGRADIHDGDGYVTFRQLADYVKDKVKKETGHQKPQSDNMITDDGEFVFKVK